MQHCLGILAVSSLFVLRVSGQETPVGKAIQLLTSLQGKITAEGEASKKSHAEANAMCHDRSRDLGYSIQSQESEIADSKATIEQERATISTLSQKIEDLGGSIAQNDADLKASTAIRENEASDFAAEEKELVEIVNTLERAIGILKRDMQMSGSFLQGLDNKPFVQAMDALVKGSVLSAADASRLTSLVQNDKSDGLADELSLGAPEAAVYEGHSHGIIETLEDLLDRAQEQLSDARKKEATAVHNFNMLEQSLKDETKYMTNDMSDSKKAMAQSSQEKASAEGDLASTSKSLSADKESLATMTQNCEQAQRDFEAETASRQEELSAIAGALKALNDMTGDAASIAYGLNQVSPSFLQRSSLSTVTDLAGFEVVRVIRDLARKEHEPRLTQLANRVATLVQQGAGSGDDPFAKVKGLISDLIEKLQHEASTEASAKAYCDEELAESNAKKTEKSDEVDRLTASIDKMSAQSAKLKEELAALHKDLAELSSTQAEMDKLRREEHEAFTKNKADMEMGLQGVSLAVKLLREYFAKESKQHEAATGSGTSIIGLLEVVASDFSKDLATMSATEASAESAHKAASHQNEVTKVSKEQDVKYKTKESTQLDRAVSQATSDRANVQEQLDAVKEYLAKLEDGCSAKAMTYEERKKAREEEITGLKEALSILESETALLQQRAKRAKRALRLRSFSH